MKPWCDECGDHLWWAVDEEGPVLCEPCSRWRSDREMRRAADGWPRVVSCLLAGDEDGALREADAAGVGDALRAILARNRRGLDAEVDR